MLKLAIIFWLANSATGSKVKERFDYGHLSRTPVRIMAPALTPNKDAEVRMKAMFTEAYAEFFPRANFTSVFADTFIVGYRGEDGNYTGMVGELINHRADYVINFAMLSQHQDEPVRVGVALLQADLKIFTDDWKSEIIAVDFLHTFQNVRSEFGIWLFLSFHIVAVTYVWFDSYNFNISSYAVIYWFGMLTMLDQEGLSCSKWKPRFLWFFTCVAISIVVFGYILNLMSSDSIVIRDPPRINSIDDMFIKPFSSFKVYMYTTTTFYNYMRNARPGTKMAAIYKRAADRANCSRLIDCGEIEFRSDPQGSLKLLEFYDELMATRDHALLTSDMVMVQVTAPSVCRFRPELYNTTYTSTEHIATDILTFIARKGIDSQAEKYLNFRMQTSFAESGLTQIFPLIYIDAVFEEMMPHVAKRNAQYYSIFHDSFSSIGWLEPLNPENLSLSERYCNWLFGRKKARRKMAPSIDESRLQVSELRQNLKTERVRLRSAYQLIDKMIMEKMETEQVRVNCEIEVEQVNSKFSRIEKQLEAMVTTERSRIRFIEFQKGLIDNLETEIIGSNNIIKLLETSLRDLKATKAKNLERLEALSTTLAEKTNESQKLQCDLSALQASCAKSTTVIDQLKTENSLLQIRYDKSCKVTEAITRKLLNPTEPSWEIVSSSDRKKQSPKSSEDPNARSEVACPLCLATHVQLKLIGAGLTFADCGHIMCPDCLDGLSRIKQGCPLCHNCSTT
ncbi:hypothetical protein HDE_06499 [Halotydeus destructor]|nr:hypothetical protein HDE_06499 [Halotydeus destructor]